MTNDPLDPLMDALSELRSIPTPESHSRRVRGDCRAMLAGHRHAAPPIRLADLVVVAGLAVYLVAVVTEAVRLLG